MWDLVVIGTGAMGAATCWQASRRGARVVALERFARGHDFGSTHGGSRVLRESYFEHPDYVPLLLAARHSWAELEAEAGVQCVHRVGMLFAGRNGSPVLEGSLSTARAFGIPHVVLDAAELAHRFPQFALGPGWMGMLETGAGFGIPEATVQACLAVAEARGAVIREGVCVDSVEARRDRVVVSTNAGPVEAAAAVVTAGPWTSTLLRELGVPLAVQRHLMVWFAPREPQSCTAPALPVWAVDGGEPGFYYGVPAVEGVPGPRGVKVGWHGPAPAIDPDTADRIPRPEELERFAREVGALAPAIGGHVIGAKTCLYTCTPDGHFVVDRMPGAPRIATGCGYSGHGFKFAPLMGEILADLALDGGTRHPIAFLGLDRFAQA